MKATTSVKIELIIDSFVH